MKIILDAMGGDHAPEAPVLGAIEAAKTFGAQITLVGRGEEILSAMGKHGITDLPAGIEIANADDVVDMHDDPASVIRKRKNSSMVVGLKMLADGLGDAFADVEAFLGKCRFSDCRHETEPGCAIKAAIATCELDASRWDSYRKLKEEAVDKAEMLRRKREWHKSLRKGEKLKKKEIW